MSSLSKNVEVVKVGKVDVDSGLIWVGDPCYSITLDANSHPAKTWKEFCDKFIGNTDKQVSKNVQNGIGYVVGTVHGDGTYDVYAEKKDGVIVKIIIDIENWSALDEDIDSEEEREEREEEKVEEDVTERIITAQYFREIGLNDSYDMALKLFGDKEFTEYEYCHAVGEYLRSISPSPSVLKRAEELTKNDPSLVEKRILDKGEEDWPA